MNTELRSLANRINRRVDKAIEHSSNADRYLFNRLDAIDKKVSKLGNAFDPEKSVLSARLNYERGLIQSKIASRRIDSEINDAKRLSELNKIFPDRLDLKMAIDSAVPRVLRALPSSVPFDGAVLSTKNGSAIWVDIAGLISSRVSPYTFSCSMGNGVVRVKAGYRQVIGQSPVLYSNGTGLDDVWEFSYVDGNMIWFKWTFSTESAGVITDGSWSSIASGTPDADDETAQVFIIAEMSGGKVYQRHLGDVVVEDRLICADCPAC